LAKRFIRDFMMVLLLLDRRSAGPISAARDLFNTCCVLNNS